MRRAIKRLVAVLMAELTTPQIVSKIAKVDHDDVTVARQRSSAAIDKALARIIRTAPISSESLPSGIAPTAAPR